MRNGFECDRLLSYTIYQKVKACNNVFEKVLNNYFIAS